MSASTTHNCFTYSNSGIREIYTLKKLNMSQEKHKIFFLMTKKISTHRAWLNKKHEKKYVSVSHSNDIKKEFFCANNETFDIRHLHRKLTNIHAICGTNRM